MLAFWSCLHPLTLDTNVLELIYNISITGPEISGLRRVKEDKGCSNLLGEPLHLFISEIWHFKFNFYFFYLGNLSLGFDIRVMVAE